MSVLQKIREKKVISRALLCTLVFSLLLLPLATWSAYGHMMQSPSLSHDTMELNADVSMNHCHHQSEDSNTNTCSKNCCNNFESNQNCNNCQCSCMFTVFIYINSDNANPFLKNYGIVLKSQSAITSRSTTPPFRPPITLLS